MGRPRMVWSKAARDKLEEELDHYLDAALFLIVKFERPNDVVKVASDNISAVMKDLQDIVSSKTSANKQQQPQKDDVSLIISDSRLKVENQLQYVCDNDVSRNNNKAFKDFVVQFKSKMQRHSNAVDNEPGTSKKKGKASKLTLLELQQQKDDEEKLRVCLDKQAAVRKLTRDYHKTVRFMEKFVPTKGPLVEAPFLIHTLLKISKDYRYLFDIHGYDEKDKWFHLDVSQLIKEYKSKLETELQEFCDKVSDPSIKEAFSQHLTEVIAQNHCPDLHNKDKKRMSTKQKVSVIQKKRSSLLPRRHDFSSLNIPSPLKFPNHSQCCFKNNSKFDRHLMKSPPQAEE